MLGKVALIILAVIGFFAILNMVFADSPLNLAGLSNFAILSNTYTNSINPNTLNGDLGYNVAPALFPTVNGVIHVSPTTSYNTAQSVRATLYANLNDPLQTGDCTFTVGTALVLDSLTQPITPGVYCIDGAASITNSISFSGNGYYVFRISGTLDATMSSQVILNGVDPNTIFWVPVGATTLGDDSIFAGNIVSDAAITLLSTVTLDGRILSNGAVTTTGSNISINSPPIKNTQIPPVIPPNDCGKDCVPPTLGVDKDNVRFVDNGFIYNGNIVNVNLFNNNSPLITTKIGDVNKAVFKIYEIDGSDKVRHLDLAFGLSEDQSISDSLVRIEWNREWNNLESTKIVDSGGFLKDVKVITTKGECKISSIIGDCQTITIYHTFTKPLEFNGVATNIWDDRKNSWQNYFKLGVKVLPKTPILDEDVIIDDDIIVILEPTCKPGLTSAIRKASSLITTDTEVCLKPTSKLVLFQRGWAK